VIEPVLAGTLERDETYDDDLAYTRDLGLVAPTRPVRIANPIYHEVIARVLTANVEEVVSPTHVRSCGTTDASTWRRCSRVRRVLAENADILVSGTVYHEVAPQLVLMGFLQRLVNGGGLVSREYGAGRGRIDILIRWPYSDRTANGAGSGRRSRRRCGGKGKGDPLAEGLVPTRRLPRPPRPRHRRAGRSSTGAPTSPPSPSAPGSKRPPARLVAR
jgi:hypothetical protein